MNTLAGTGEPRRSTQPAAARAAGLVVLGVAAARMILSAAPARGPRTISENEVRGAARLAPRWKTLRLLHGAAALLGFSVLADSAVEHDRGSFENPGMWAPLITSAATVLAGASGAGGAGRLGRVRRHVYRTAVGVGAAGTGFHVFNVRRRPGRLSWQNLFYGAPLGAPAALSLAGLVGSAAEAIAAQPHRVRPELAGLPAGRALAGLASVGLVGTVGEAWLLHFRGAFHNPVMVAPVALPPLAAAFLARDALGPRSHGGYGATRLLLAATALMGVAGVGFHAYGVSRAMGGWRNWRQNVIDGPPLPAPPAFSALALVGLAALNLFDPRAEAAR